MAPRQVAGAEPGGRAGVDEEHAGFQGGGIAQVRHGPDAVLEAASTLLVQRHVVAEILGHEGLVFEQDLDKLVLRHGLQGVVGFQLLGNGAIQVRAGGFAAEAARAVGGVHPGAAGQGHELVAGALVHLGRQLFALVAAHGLVLAQVGSAHVAHKQRIAGEHGAALGQLIHEQDADGVGRVAGRVDGVQLVAAQLEAVAVVEVFVRVFGPHQLAAIDGGLSFLRNFQVRRHEIGVRVRLNHGDDAGVVLVGKIVVLLRVAAGVDDGHLAAAAHGVAGVGQALVVKLLDLHGRGRATGEGRHGKRGFLAGWFGQI